MKIAICIPTRNRIRTLIDAVDSLVKQDKSQFDIHIFDNFSNDDSENIIKSQFENIKYHKYEVNVGYVGNINRCLSLAPKYDWIGILHSDDIHFQNSINQFIEYANRYPFAGMIFSKCHQIDSEGQIINLEIGNEMIYKAGKQAVIKCFSGIPCSSTFYNCRAILKAGYFSDEYPYSADQEYAARIAKDFDLIQSEQIFACYRRHEGHLMVKTWTKSDFIESFERMRIKMMSYTGDITRSEILNVKKNVAKELVSCCNTLIVHGEIKSAFRIYLNVLLKNPLYLLSPKTMIKLCLHSIPFLNVRIAKKFSKYYK